MDDYDPESGGISDVTLVEQVYELQGEAKDGAGMLRTSENTEENLHQESAHFNLGEYDYFIDLQSPSSISLENPDAFRIVDTSAFPHYDSSSMQSYNPAVKFYSHNPTPTADSDSFLSVQSDILKSEHHFLVDESARGHRTTTTTYNPPGQSIQSAYGADHDNCYSDLKISPANNSSNYQQLVTEEYRSYVEGSSEGEYYAVEYHEYHETSNYPSQEAGQANNANDEAYNQYNYYLPQDIDHYFQDSYPSSYDAGACYNNIYAADPGAQGLEEQYAADFYAEQYKGSFADQQAAYHEDQRIEYLRQQPLEDVGENDALEVRAEPQPSHVDYLAQQTIDDESLSGLHIDTVPPQNTVAMGTRPASETEKRMHLKVWERFFENALAHKQQLQDLEGDDQQQVTYRGGASVDMDLDGNAPVAFSSLFGRKFFTSAITSPSPDPGGAGNAAQKSKTAMETGWKILVSASRYQSLIRLANAAPKPPHRDAHKGKLVRQLCLFAAVITNDTSTVQSLLYDGVEVGVQDEQGRGLLHYATRFNSTAVIPILFDQNVDIDVMDTHEHTALHIAMGYNRGKVVKFLLDSAVNMDIEDVYGISPRALGLALGHVDCVHLLDGGEPLGTFEDDADSGEVSGLVSPIPPPRPSATNTGLQRDSKKEKIASKLPSMSTRKDFQPADQLLRNLKYRYGGRLMGGEEGDEVLEGNEEIQTEETGASGKLVEEKQLTGSDSEGADGDDGEEEEEVEGESLSELVAAKVWGMTIDLIGLTMGLLFGDKRSEGKKKGKSKGDIDIGNRFLFSSLPLTPLTIIFRL
ncbi:ankyrin repeat domain-containing protein [archaeon]|nr:MAG: ankyrin repeat domain-containing protein [archaeon]